MTKQIGILTVDQGTTSTRAIVFSPESEILAIAQQEFPQVFLQNGWVEHDPEVIWQSTLTVCRQAMQQASLQHIDIQAMGITNQRETIVVWHKETGQPLYNALVWQDRRTAEQCRALKQAGCEDLVKTKTGLLLDPYFSASKLAWILENVAGARALANAGKLLCGTIDSFLIWRFNQGSVHATDVTNASRTSLFNINTLKWDKELLNLFNIPASMLPEVHPCTHDYGCTEKALLGETLPILGVAGDQQAAAIGQCCFSAGDLKSTYGTGAFALLNTGEKPFTSSSRLLTTIGYQIDGRLSYALEGSIFIAGAAIQWLRDGLQVLKEAHDSENLAGQLDYQHGVYLVPAFAGLGAPYWQPDVRGALFGLTRATDARHLTRAALESVCYQTNDLLRAMINDGACVNRLNVDGGMVVNNWLCQFLSDIVNMPVARPQIKETTALGAAYLAGLQAGIFTSLKAIQSLNSLDRQFTPALAPQTRESLLNGWQQAMKATLAF